MANTPSGAQAQGNSTSDTSNNNDDVIDADSKMKN